MSSPFDTPLNAAIEQELYERSEKSGFFDPERLPGRRKNVFSIVLPPPNVTGILHIGHALMLTIQDVMVRYHRMKGDKTLWLPGTDHAAIATQEKFERELYKKEEKTRHDLGREEFLRRVNEFALANQKTIIHQMKRMGASLDWSRLAFTLDEPRTRAVHEAFKRMYDAGLIYRGERIVNWDPKLQTTVSDDEVEWKEEKAPLYYLKYGPFTIATARPETKFGDKYVVMHPADKRYAKYKDGEKLNVEWINGTVTATIIKDKVIDMKFGTGVMTITPWHDATDFEIAERRKLDKEQIINLHGKLLPIAGEFAGKKIVEARPLIVEKLNAKGLLEKVDEKYVHRVATSSRGGGLVEPQILKQWFVNVHSPFTIPHSTIKGISSSSKTTLKEIMVKAVKGGQIKIIPKRFEKTYFHWINNLRDWCISRQIWYGHRIPVWYHEPKCVPKVGREGDIVKCKELIVASEKPTCEFCDAEFTQDPDTLDTWFSSGLWTFSTLGWPEKAQDLRFYHPTSVLETGYDILFFWVARMILMTGFLLGDVPFKTVYLNGLVRGEDRQKMSKSKGNAIDPLGVAEQYGTDAVRMALIIGNAPGNDPIISEDKIRGYRNFTTKLWNIARFIAMNDAPEFLESKARFSKRDEARRRELAAFKKRVTALMDSFQYHVAAERIYHYLWHTFADEVIEEAKPRLKDVSSADRAAAHALLRELFLESLILLHPFMPFVTEAIYQHYFRARIPDSAPFLMVTSW